MVGCTGEAGMGLGYTRAHGAPLWTPPHRPLSSHRPAGLQRACVERWSRGPAVATHTHTLPGFESLESWALRANCPEPAFLINKAGIVRIKKTKCSDGLMPW